MGIVDLNYSTNKWMDLASPEENALTVTSLDPLSLLWSLISLIPSLMDKPGVFSPLHAMHCTYAPSQVFTVPFHF